MTSARNVARRRAMLLVAALVAALIIAPADAAAAGNDVGENLGRLSEEPIAKPTWRHFGAGAARTAMRSSRCASA